MRCLRTILGSPLDPAPMPSRAAWWERHRAIAASERAPFDRAVLGGFAADRLGYAFASGYQAALRALVPDLPDDRVASLCVTERGGAHPGAIETSLEAAGEGRLRITGRKRWATLSGDAGVLLVAASAGVDERGRKRIRVARVAVPSAGVTLTPMPETPFIPEIGHDDVRIEGAMVSEADVLPGDGYERYVKPFRTVEDIHVQAALFGYFVREVRLNGFPRALIERLAAQIAGLAALAREDPSAPEVHVALAGILAAGKPIVADIERLWATSESPSHARWERDRLLLGVAESARGKRIERAFERLGIGEGSSDRSLAGGVK